MTPKERRDAQIELRDMALELERWKQHDSDSGRADRFRQAVFLRLVATELDRVPEEQ